MADVNQNSAQDLDSVPQQQPDSPDGQATAVYHCTQEDQHAAGVEHAQQALAADQCVVIPTDTVYGIAANAFSAEAVERLLQAKGRNRTMPPPVLIAHVGVMDGLADDVSDDAHALAQAFWPGGLTLICHAQPSLQWDLGETQGTVALRVPDDQIARELLSAAGPLAVSSANKTGLPAAISVQQAREMLRDKVAVYLDAGPRGHVATTGSSAHPVVSRVPEASTIVDCTGQTPTVVREGIVTVEQLRTVVPSVVGPDHHDAADKIVEPEPQGPQETTELPDQDRRRTTTSSSQQPQPVDRATAATLVARGGDAGKIQDSTADQNRRRDDEA